MMTQAFTNATVVNQLKMPFDNLFCEAEVDTLMQMSEEVDMEEMENTKIEELPKEEEPQKILMHPVDSIMKGKLVKERKPRPGRPYNLLSRRRKEQARRQRRTVPHPAPVNTNQFLMSDCNDRLGGYSDSDAEDDDGNDRVFGMKEFRKDYEKAIPMKQKMPKSKLIEEYMLVEKGVKLLEKKYEEMSAQEQLKARLGTVDYDWEKGEVAMEPETAEKIRIFQEEILKIAEENRKLALENSRLVAENKASKSESSESDTDSDSSDSDTDSSSSDSDSDTDTDSSEDDENEVTASSTDCVKDSDSESKKDDTGYESDDSKSLTRVTSSTTGIQ